MDLLRSGGVGMKIEPTRVTIRSWSFLDLIGAAYRIRTDQIAGPEWMSALRWDVQAIIPAGAKSDEVPEMLQSLLAIRFSMRSHRAQKDFPVYALTAGSKDSLRLRESSPTDTTPSGCTSTSNHRTCHRMSMSALADLLTQLSRMYAAMPPGGMNWGIEAPTIDMTNLPGAYDFPMDYGPGAEDIGGGSVMDAVERLGLRLEKQRRPYEQIVIDHLEKSPTEN
jgi:uncharacterized protein (TIGR03435 family)